MALALFVAIACEEVDKLLTFRINDRTTIRIENTSPLNLPVEIPTPAVTTNSQQQYENNNTDKSHVAYKAPDLLLQWCHLCFDGLNTLTNLG